GSHHHSLAFQPRVTRRPASQQQLGAIGAPEGQLRVDRADQVVEVRGRVLDRAASVKSRVPERDPTLGGNRLRRQMLRGAEGERQNCNSDEAGQSRLRTRASTRRNSDREEAVSLNRPKPDSSTKSRTSRSLV